MSQSSRRRRKSQPLARRRRLFLEPLEDRRVLAGVAYDGFEDYAAGSQVHGQNGGEGWNGAWSILAADQPTVTVVNASLSYSAGDITIDGGERAMQYVTPAGSNIDVLATRTMPAQSGTLYLSFLYNNSANAGNQADFMQLGFRNAGGEPLLSALDRSDSSTVGPFAVRRGTSGTGQTVDTAVPSTVGQTYFIVLKVEATGSNGANYDRATIYVNPTSYVEGNNTAVATSAGTASVNMSQLTHFAIRRAFHETGDTYLIDEIRVADSFQSALGAAVWDGDAANGLWHDPLNWVGDKIPDAGEQVYFYNTGVGTVDLAGNAVDVKSVHFMNTAGSFELTGGTLHLEQVENNGTQNNTVSAALHFTGSSITNNTPGSTLFINGTVDVSLADLTVNGAGDVWINGVIQGANGIEKDDSGTLTLAGLNTYGGGTNVNAGTLRLAENSTLVAHYTFDGHTADASGNGHDGTINGGGTSYTAGQFGQALTLTGSQDVSVPFSSSFGLNTFTVSAWVNIPVEQTNGGILGTRFGGDTTFDLKVRAADIHGDVGNGAAWINTAVDIGPGHTGSNAQGGTWRTTSGT